MEDVNLNPGGESMQTRRLLTVLALLTLLWLAHLPRATTRGPDVYLPFAARIPTLTPTVTLTPTPTFSPTYTATFAPPPPSDTPWPIHPPPPTATTYPSRTPTSPPTPTPTRRG